MLTIEEAAARLQSFQDVLILTHLNPDGDTVGCGAGLCAALRAVGKTAYLLDNPQLTKNNRTYFAPYAAPEDFQPKNVVALDSAEQKRLQINAGPYLDRIDLTIDHHLSFVPYGKEYLTRPSSAACGEILYDIIRLLTPITPEIALPLYVALSTDTGGFVYANTTAETHRIAAALIDTGIDYHTVNKVFFKTKTRVRMELEAAMLQHALFLDRDRVAILTVTMAMKESFHATRDDVDDLSAFGGQIEGVDCAVTLHEHEPNLWRCSLRTVGPNPRVNASTVCVQLGGGGHAAAAGATLTGTLEDVRERTLAAIAQCVPDFQR